MEYFNIKILDGHKHYSKEWMFDGEIEYCMIYINRADLEDNNWEQISIFKARYGKS